jgi:hypothetical protein
MKKLMLTTAMVTVITTAAIAQTTITGELRISGTMLNADKGFAATSGTANSSYGMGSEQQINIQTKGKLNLGGLDYAAGFAIENDGDQTTTIFNENTFIDITASSGTTLSLSRDHIQRSDTDFAATNLVGFSPNEFSQTGTTTNQSTRFKQSIGAAPSQSFGAALLQKTPVGTFSYNYVPNNGGVTAGTLTTTSGDTAGTSGSETASANTTSAYEYGFLGDLGVKGLTVHYFKNANEGHITAANDIKAEGKNYGVKYNFGQVTVGANKKIHQAETTTSSRNSATVGTGNAEITETAYAAAYAVNKDVTVGLLYAKAEQDNMTVEQKVKAINIGYALGPVDLSVGYAQNTNMGGIIDNDGDHFIARFIGKF